MFIVNEKDEVQYIGMDDAIDVKYCMMYVSVIAIVTHSHDYTQYMIDAEKFEGTFKGCIDE